MQQEKTCERFGVERVAPDPERNSGVSGNVINGEFFKAGTWPLHGCRYLPTETTTGWYVWAGELSEAADFFTNALTRDTNSGLPRCSAIWFTTALPTTIASALAATARA